MTQTTSSPVTFPTTRPAPFDPPEDLIRWQALAPLQPMRYPGGHLGWLVTGYAAARSILADPRFSTKPDNMHSPLRERQFDSDEVEPLEGFFLQMDPPEHTRFRKLLTGQPQVSPAGTPYRRENWAAVPLVTSLFSWSRLRPSVSLTLGAGPKGPLIVALSTRVSFFRSPRFPGRYHLEG